MIHKFLYMLLKKYYCIKKKIKILTCFKLLVFLNNFFFIIPKVLGKYRALDMCSEIFEHNLVLEMSEHTNCSHKSSDEANTEHSRARKVLGISQFSKHFALHLALYWIHQIM